MRKQTLRDVAIIQNREKLLHEDDIEVTQRTLLFIGSPKSGKTNLINQLLEREKASNEPPSTYLLDYRYGRQSGKSLMVKDVCHIWELGNGITYSSLLSVVLKPRQATTVILVLDLTSPETISKMAQTLLDTVKSCIIKDKEANSTETTPIKQLNPNIEEEDRPHLQPFPVPLVIIGGKYDLFQNMEPAKKRIICQYLRCLAHVLQADLFFYSNTDNKLVKSARDFLLEYAFGISASINKMVTDYNKPLSIPNGCDSFTSIQGSSMTAVNYSLDKYKNNLIAHFKQESSLQEDMPDDPASDPNFLERAIDNLCIQKIEELKRNREENQRKVMAVQLMKRTKRVNVN